MEQNNPQTENYQSTAILKELSDIKSNLAVNSSETLNIKNTIVEIKGDIRDIKSDFVTRREFNDAIKTIREGSPDHDFENRLRMLEKFRWQFAGGISILTIVADYILYNVLKK